MADDDRLARTIYADALRAVGHRVSVAADGVEALRQLTAEPFDLLVTDVLMPEMDGLELLERAKRALPGLDVIMLTSVGAAEPAIRAMRNGAFHYLVKPVDPEALELEVSRCLETRRLLAENAELRRYQGLLGAAQRISACPDAERLYPVAVETLAGLVGADAGVLFRPSAEADGLERLAVCGVALAPEALDAFWAERGPDLSHVTAPTATPPGALNAGDRADFASAMLVPLRRSGAPLAAVLLLRGPAREPFGARELTDGAILGESLALALENADRSRQAQLVSHLDTLTGLYNARHLEHVIDREIRARGVGGQPFSLLFMDLDHFKRVNDTHGHQVGSRVLVEMGRLLRRQTREGDILIRYGGDEFVAILPDADTETGMKAAERIRQAVEGHRFLSREGLGLQLTLCCGVCSWPAHAHTREDVVHRADMAMYRGKKAHRNAVYVYDEVPDGSTLGSAPTPPAVRPG